MADFLDIVEGGGPLILSQPHSGRRLPPGLEARLTETARRLPDTDWWVDKLYDFPELDLSVVRSQMSRYVIDLNRDPSGKPLYPGQAATGLVPTECFDGAPVYLPGEAPDAAEISERRYRYFEPYHAALSAQIARVKAKHGFAILYDCHSIRAHVPRLFEGTLPTLNLGTYEGASCALALSRRVAKICAISGYSAVSNGRFTGGWITRHYGRPYMDVHALQMELAQSAYMREDPPFTYLPDQAARLRATLRDILHTLLHWALEKGTKR